MLSMPDIFKNQNHDKLTESYLDRKQRNLFDINLAIVYGSTRQQCQMFFYHRVKFT